MYHFHLADDHPLFRNALVSIVEQHFPEAVITESVDLESTLTALNGSDDIDLLLLDLTMPGSQDLFGLVTVRERFATTPVAIVSAREDIDTISRAIGHGAAGYIPKSASPAVILEAIQTITNGESWIPAFARNRLKPLNSEEASLAARIANLTPQQYRVLCLLREGGLNKQIAYQLGVTEATVKAHITSIFRKLQVNNRTQAVVMLSKMSLDHLDAGVA
ncbi:response regulator transcription factor [Allohahella marinimesophila]|uniref:Response regulator transcription factor n=1 Tax=Allohahella marinimesophila TaxID=1054972 RepID=A0ABP7PCH5_9GAMM